MINDGKMAREHLTASIDGCNTNPTVRYHNERADFQVTDASRAQIHVYENKLHIKIDARNTGEWQECVTLSTEALPAGWLASSYLGVTSSTGQLADNHDIISVEVDTDLSGQDSKVISEKAAADQIKNEGRVAKLPDKVLYESTSNLATDQRLAKIEHTLNSILVRLEQMDLETEHSGVAAQEKIRNIIGKLSKREDDAEKRIEHIEMLVKESVGEHIDMHLEDRLANHGEQIRLDVHHTMTDLADHVHTTAESISAEKEKLQAQFGDLVNKTMEGGGGWKIPFLFLLLVIIAGAIGFYQFRQTLLKKHFL